MNKFPGTQVGTSYEKRRHSGFKGGVHLTKDPVSAGKLVEAMVGNRLTTKQTAPEGVPVSKVMVCHVSSDFSKIWRDI